MTEFRIGYDDPALRVGSARNLFVNVWSGEITVARLEALLEHERQLRRRHGGGFAVASIVATMPTALLKLDEAARRAAADIAREMNSSTIALADVVLGQGFWSAAVRSVMAGFHLFTRPGYPRRTFDSLDGASAWLATALQSASAEPWSAAEVTAVLRAAIAGRGAT